MPRWPPGRPRRRALLDTSSAAATLHTRAATGLRRPSAGEVGLPQGDGAGLEPGSAAWLSSAGPRLAPAIWLARCVFSSQAPTLAGSLRRGQWGNRGRRATRTRGCRRTRPAPARPARRPRAPWRRAGPGPARLPLAGAHHGRRRAPGRGVGITSRPAVAVGAPSMWSPARRRRFARDVHHGNGTQRTSDAEPRAPTGSGARERAPPFPRLRLSRAKVGGGGGSGTLPRRPAARSPATPPTSRRPGLVMAPVVRVFGPTRIAAEGGVAHHHADPLDHLLTTTPPYRELWARLRALAEEVCGSRIPRWAAGATSPAPRRHAPGRAGRRAGGAVRGGARPRGVARHRPRGRVPRPGPRMVGGPRSRPDPERDRRAAAESEAAIAQASSPCRASGAQPAVIASRAVTSARQ